MPVDHGCEAPAATLVHAPRGWQRVGATFGRIGAFAIVELRKLQHDRTELVTRMMQPALWLLIFGTTFSKLHVINTGAVSYLAFLAPGIIAQSALFISIFYGIQIIWDRDAGVLAKLMVTPAPASALISGKAFAAGVRSIAQVVGVLALAYLMRVSLTVNPLRILAAMATVMLGAAFFACLSMTLAGLVRNRDRLMGIGQAGHHDAAVLRVERAVPRRRDAVVAAGAQHRQSAELRGRRAAGAADRHPVAPAGPRRVARRGGARNCHGVNAFTTSGRLGGTGDGGQPPGAESRADRDRNVTMSARLSIVSEPRSAGPAATNGLAAAVVFDSPRTDSTAQMRQMKVGMGKSYDIR